MPFCSGLSPSVNELLACVHDNNGPSIKVRLLEQKEKFGCKVRKQKEFKTKFESWGRTRQTTVAILYISRTRTSSTFRIQ